MRRARRAWAAQAVGLRRYHDTLARPVPELAAGDLPAPREEPHRPVVPKHHLRQHLSLLAPLDVAPDLPNLPLRQLARDLHLDLSQLSAHVGIHAHVLRATELRLHRHSGAARGAVPPPAALLALGAAEAHAAAAAAGEDGARKPAGKALGQL